MGSADSNGISTGGAPIVGASYNSAGGIAGANTGGGGGGTTSYSYGGGGGSGIVVIAFPNARTS